MTTSHAFEHTGQLGPEIMNFALLVVTGRRKFDHVSDVREELGWLIGHIVIYESRNRD